jgi:hypothetical protein
MKKLKYLKMLPLLVFGLHLFSCKKFVDVGAPATQLINSSVFTSDATATR